MLVSHESPISLLETSRLYNDYDYALVHLFELYPEYYDYFRESIKTRLMYLDNSIFELGSAFSTEKFIMYCNEFADINENNFHYVVPDVLENCDATIENFKKFNFNRGKRIGVAQGNSFNDTLKCYDFLADKCDIIGISFDYSWFNNSMSLDYRMKKRVEFIEYLKDSGRLKGKKIHLLGCYLPQEFKYYKNTPEIYSIDTSNPVVHGIKGIRYTKQGLNSKESQKLVDLIETENIPLNVLYNIMAFRKFFLN